MKTFTKSLISLLLMLLWVAHAGAHGAIEQTNPPDGSILEAAPQQVDIWFTDAISPGSASVTVVNGDNSPIPTSEITYNVSDARQISIELPSQLPPATYIVSADAVVQSDGHEVRGSFVFWVGEPAASTPSPETSQPNYPLFLLFMGVMLAIAVFGVWSMRRPPLEVASPE